MGTRSYYDVLGIPKTATDAEIKKAYRQAALKFHPDRNPNNPTAAERFREAAEAYETLGDPERRKIYDQFGATGEKRRPADAGQPPHAEYAPPHQQPSQTMEEMYIQLGWELVKDYGRYVPVDTFEYWFKDELQAGIRLPFVTERVRDPKTGAPVVWMKKIKKSGSRSQTHTTKRGEDVSFLEESLAEVGLSPKDLSFSELQKFAKDIGVSVGVKILKTLMGRK